MSCESTGEWGKSKKGANLLVYKRSPSIFLPSVYNGGAYLNYR